MAGLALTTTVMANAEAKYIFYFIGDGMGMGPAMAAANYNRLALNKDELPLMMTFPVVGQAMTYSASRPVTDSAAAGTALSTGHKTKNSMLGMDADTVAVYSIANTLKDNGFGIGVVTTVAPDDATPGAFYAHVPKRSMFNDINRQFAEGKVDFLAGSALRGLKDQDGNDAGILDLYKKNNINVAYGLDGLANVEVNKGKIVLLDKNPFQDGNVGYTIDSIPGMLTLPQMTQACLDYLEASTPDKFFMMVEGGNIDHALHANDGGAAIKEIINFNQALAVAFDFYEKHPDETLIIVTADHDTGGMSMIKPSKHGAGLSNIDFQRVSKEGFSKYCEGVLRSRMVYKWQDMKEYLTENLGFYTHIRISDSQEATLEKQFNDTFELRNSDDQKTLYANFNRFAVEVFRIFNDATGLAFTTTSHSGNPVPVFAVGAGAEKFRHYNNNINIAPAILDTVISGK